jgi:hypothetical protein
MSIRKVEPFEDIDNGIKVQLHFSVPSTYGFSSHERKSFSEYIALFLPRDTTSKQLHNYLFNMLGKATEIKDYEKDVV